MASGFATRPLASLVAADAGTLPALEGWWPVRAELNRGYLNPRSLSLAHPAHSFFAKNESPHAMCICGGSSCKRHNSAAYEVDVMSEKYPNHRWKHDDRWKTHSMACWEKEWELYKEIARLVGAKSTNAWIRDSLNQCVAYERMNLADRSAGLEENAASSPAQDSAA